MAKRAVLEHPKFSRLKSSLKCNRATALGYLECLWHFTGRFTPQGDIGKFSDEDIEAWVEWDGEPGDLIAAFMKCGWIDEDHVCRLIVHDWKDHADNATKMTLKRAGLVFTEYTPVGSTVETPCKQGANGVDTELSKADTVLTPPSHPSPSHAIPPHAMPCHALPPETEIVQHTGSVMDYFNALTARSLSATGGQGDGIRARLKDGSTVAELCLVIDFKYSEWTGNDEMERHINPGTLFRPKKFELYLDDANRWDAAGRPAQGGTGPATMAQQLQKVMGNTG